MDYRLSRLLLHCALILLLLEIHQSKVISAPIHENCEILDRTRNLADFLEDQTRSLLSEYINFHGNRPESIPDDVPDSQISGNNFSEKLLDMVTKNMLFNLHISKVEEYQVKDWKSPKAIQDLLFEVKGRLSQHLFLIKHILKSSYPEIPEQPTPAPLQLSHEHYYAKKVYGWGVIDSLKRFLQNVVQELIKAGCDQKTQES